MEQNILDATLWTGSHCCFVGCGEIVVGITSSRNSDKPTWTGNNHLQHDPHFAGRESHDQRGAVLFGARQRLPDAAPGFAHLSGSMALCSSLPSMPCRLLCGMPCILFPACCTVTTSLFARNRPARPRKHLFLCKGPAAVAPLCRLDQKISPGAVTSSKGQIGRCTLV